MSVNMWEKFESQLTDILKIYIDSRRIPVALEVLRVLALRKATSPKKSMTVVEILKLVHCPASPPTFSRTTRELESLGFLNRMYRYQGYYLAHNFSNQRRKSAQKWIEFLEVVGEDEWT